jgi:enterochelin esterase-like enzyme
MKLTTAPQVTIQRATIRSSFLNREVQLTIVLPPDYRQKPYPVLWLNDGQDMEPMGVSEILASAMAGAVIPHIITVGIHANEDRLQEYGSSSAADYKQRGTKAGIYAEFFINELIPFIRNTYSVSRDRRKNAIAGWSMGGLSAIDIAWHHPEAFTRVGVFSGSLWWRMKAYNRGYKDDKHRIAHQMIRNSTKREGLKFWFECGTQDEKADRNKNGLIDAIDDTIDLIRELKEKGYTDKEDISFVVVKEGEHDLRTWAAIMPHFLQWAFGK